MSHTVRYSVLLKIEIPKPGQSTQMKDAGNEELLALKKGEK